MMRRDTRGWRECHWKENSLERQWVEHLLSCRKGPQKNKKEYKTQALSSFWVEGVPKISSYNHPKELSEDEFWRGLLAHALPLCRPRALMDPGPLDTLHKWVISALTALHLQLLPGTHVTHMIEKQSPSLSGSCGQKLMLACWTCKCHWSSICVYSRGCSDQGLEISTEKFTHFPTLSDKLLP